MRTTVDIPESLLERAKALAAARGRRLTDIVNDALREMFDRRERQAATTAHPEPLPISKVGKSGPRPGIDLSDNAALSEVLDELEGHDPKQGPPPHLHKLR